MVSDQGNIGLSGTVFRVQCSNQPLHAAILGTYPLARSSGGCAFELLAEVQFGQLRVPSHVGDFAHIILRGPDWQSGYLASPQGGVAVYNVPDAPLVAFFDRACRQLHLIAYRPNRFHVATMPVVGSVLNPLIRDALALERKYMLHAAAVMTASGKGILLIADNGGGKTTTAMQLTMSGGRFLSDDLVVVERDPAGHWIAHAVREDLNLSQQTVSFFADLARDWPADRWTGKAKIPIPVSAVFEKQQLQEQMHIAMLCRLELGGPKAVIQPINPADALGSLLRANTFLPDQIPGADAFADLADLGSHCRCVHMQTGNDPHQFSIDDFESRLT
ncbi:MAG: hypothetical protein KDK39_18925 [Leptospiraceae bacterium]|nr:hypothetical protein [Leptospiraceae bacterium]